MEGLHTFSIIAYSARIFGILVCLPLGDTLQSLPRLFIALCFGLALSQQHSSLVEHLMWYHVPTEFIIGAVLAMPIRVLAESADMLGELLDTARGQTIGSINDPLNGTHASDMASLFRLGAVALVIHLGGIEHTIGAVRASYTYLPVGLLTTGEEVLPSVFTSCIEITSNVVALSSVWLVAYLISDLACALLARVSQGLSFTSTSTLLKMVVTFLLLMNLLGNSGELAPLARWAAWSPRGAEEVGKP